MARMSGEWTKGLIELLEQQRGIYAALDGLGERQGRLVETGDAGGLIELLSERQKLIDRLWGLSGKMEGYRKEWGAVWSELDEKGRERVMGLIREVEGLNERIMRRDEGNRVTLLEKRGVMAGEMAKASRGAAVNKAYRQGGQGMMRNRYADHQG